MILLLDHHDSFVHVLASYVERLGATARVLPADATTFDDVTALGAARIILSPGPGTPAQCPLALRVVRELGPRVPILGVCLGHQVIAEAYGAVVTRAAHPRHGMTSPMTHDGLGLFAGLPSPLSATRYHSLAVRRDSLPDALVCSATSDDGEVMGVRHATHPVEGVQFHPESVLTEHGLAMLANFLGAGR